MTSGTIWEHVHVGAMDIRACQECKPKSFSKPTSIFCCHFMFTYGLFGQKKVSKIFCWWERDLKMSPTIKKLKFHVTQT